jgi:hypothetical protein
LQVTLLKNPANDKLSMCEVKTLWKNGVREIKDTSMNTSNLINNNYENNSVGLYRHDINVPG